MPPPDPDIVQDVFALVREARATPDGAPKVALYEQAVALADTSGDDMLGYVVRGDALWPAYHGRRPDRLLVWYAWNLAFLDRNPEEDPDDTLWSYRWVLDAMPDFPSISRAQIDAAWDDMRARYKANGYSMRPVWLNRRVHLVAMGDGAGAADAHRHFARTKPGGKLADDADVDGSFNVKYHVFLKQDKAAVAEAEPFLNGTVQSVTVLLGTLDRVLLPLVRLGRADEAKAVQKRSAKLRVGRPPERGGADEAVTFLALVGDLAGAVRHFNAHFTAAHARPGDFSRLGAYQHGLFLARELVRRNKTTALKVPDDLIPGVPDGRTDPGTLRDWLEVALPELAARADARNGNRYTTDNLAELDEYAALARKLGG